MPSMWSKFGNRTRQKEVYCSFCGTKFFIKVRILYSDDSATTGKDFYDKITHGEIEEALENGKRFKTTMADDTIITFRPSTKSDDNPGVDINISKSDSHGNLKQQ